MTSHMHLECDAMRGGCIYTCRYDCGGLDVVNEMVRVMEGYECYEVCMGWYGVYGVCMGIMSMYECYEVL